VEECSTDEKPISLRGGMVFGAIWSIASIGWIAGTALIVTWFRSGWVDALFWFGLILLMGAGLFGCILILALLCEILNVTTKRSRRDGMIYFGWAFIYNFTIGGAALLIALKMGNGMGIE